MGYWVYENCPTDKKVEVQHVPNADLYQLLAYVTALGLLVYAQGEAEPVVHEVRCSGKRLEVAALDLSGTLDEVLRRVGVAVKVRALRDKARGMPRAA